MLRILLIGACGAAGAICRYLTSLACVKIFGAYFAYGTLLVNVVGCFLLGLLMHMLETEPMRISPHAHSAIAVGFLGALTTFSTFGYDTIRHAEEGQWTLAALNVLANVVLGIAAAGGGAALGRAWAV